MGFEPTSCGLWATPLTTRPCSWLSLWVLSVHGTEASQSLALDLQFQTILYAMFRALGTNPRIGKKGFEACCNSNRSATSQPCSVKSFQLIHQLTLAHSFCTVVKHQRMLDYAYFGIFAGPPRTFDAEFLPHFQRSTRRISMMYATPKASTNSCLFSPSKSRASSSWLKAKRPYPFGQKPKKTPGALPKDIVSVSSIDLSNAFGDAFLLYDTRDKNSTT
ncbi:hypothetical protein VNO77_21756 [Canavalia gladiata]|uniref:Uncharacterized protein n=1 Tax=Canavalia gladiata TaxID=3824 RepID=A0AAN9L2S1_CANGL